ncbi:MAG: hypothetical protein R3244_05685 [Thermoanaerobaculia bacterium]|nr:hypothetical protein [Thermoanaerobaculia bacterium]
MSEHYDSDSADSGSGSERPDEETVRLWLDLEADGALEAAEAARLDRALELYPHLVAERRELADLHRRLAAGRIEVDPGFGATVMRSLPPAAWEPGGRRGWGLAAIAAVMLALGAGLLLAASGTGWSASGPLLGVLTAVAELLGASLVTGAGLLGASWRGVGLVLEELFAATPSAVVGLGLGVVLLNVLFWRLLRRPARSSIERRKR